MRTIGVIDIGTNTIRAVGYSADNIKPLFETVFESNILKYTKDGILSLDGINDLSDAIGNETEFFKEKNVTEIYAFATSAMRDVKNFDEVNEHCEIEIELLSEEDEAMCDFLALTNELGENSSGVGIDLGGGSCQIIVFANGMIEYFSSFPIGVKRLYNKFGKFNSQDEILTYIKEILRDVPEFNSKTLYVMGGTGKSIAKILKTNNINTDLLCVDGFFEDDCTDMINRDKIPYGVLVISQIARLFGAESVKIMNCGSREGFVVKKR